jgi:long-chain acyl-CoA synthetase
MTQHALYAQGYASVPLYDTLGEQAVAFIVSQTKLTTVACSKVETAKLIAFKQSAASQADMASLVNVVQFEDASDDQKAAAAAAGLTLRSFEEVRAAGGFNKAAPQPPAPEDLAVLCYTSGTTGNPKGAMMSHRNMVADASAAIWNDLGITNTDIHLSYLPLAHVFEQLVENALWMQGAAVGFFQGDTLKIMEDLKALRPTIFPSVPRLFNRIYDKIMGGVQEAGGLKQALFERGFESKRQYLRDNHLTHGLWDRLVFGKVAARVGLDRCKLMVTGSAPIAAHVMEFLRIVFATRVVEGYGQTECGGAATVTNIADQATKGHVGGPLACNHVKLVSVPDMGYFHTDTVHGQEIVDGKVVNAGIECFGRGEVCYRGPNVFSGYYRDPEKTAEALDSEGWLHSGDIGLWDSHGNLRIVDRKKNIFKLSQGEYVAAEKIENLYLKSGLVQQVFVYGDSLHSMLVAIVVPDPDGLRRLPIAAGRDLAALCADPEVKKAIKADMDKVGKEAKLQGFEFAKDLFLEPEPWTPEDILTPSFKLKRADAKKKYQAQIDKLYAVLDPVAGMKNLKQGQVDGE